MNIVNQLKVQLILILLLVVSIIHAGLSIKINPFTYDGEYQEGNNIPLIYLNARYLHLPSGQNGIAYFIQRDHYDTAAKGNLFDNRYNAFAGNPIGNQDPSGNKVSTAVSVLQGAATLAAFGLMFYSMGDVSEPLDRCGQLSLLVGTNGVFNLINNIGLNASAKDNPANYAFIGMDMVMLYQTREYPGSWFFLGADMANKAAQLAGAHKSQDFDDNMAAIMNTTASVIALRNKIDIEAEGAELEVQQGIQDLRQKRSQLTALAHIYAHSYVFGEESSFIAARERIIAMENAPHSPEADWDWVRANINNEGDLSRFGNSRGGSIPEKIAAIDRRLQAGPRTPFVSLVNRRLWPAF